MPVNKYTVVWNDVYVFVYKKYAAHIVPHCMHKADIDAHIQNKEKIGNILETALARMWCQGDCQAFWKFMELLEWEFVYYEASQTMSLAEAQGLADKKLKLARAWRPPGGSLKAEAMGEEKIEVSSASTPVAPVVDTMSVEEPFVPNWDGDEPGTFEADSTWSAGPNSEWAAAAREPTAGKTIDTDERSMMAAGLYSITVGQGATVVDQKGWAWKPRNKIDQIPIARLQQAEPIDTEVLQREQGFMLLHAKYGGPIQNLLYEMQQHRPVAAQTYAWTESAKKKLQGSCYTVPNLSAPITFIQGETQTSGDASGSRTTEASVGDEGNFHSTQEGNTLT